MAVNFTTEHLQISGHESLTDVHQRVPTVPHPSLLPAKTRRPPQGGNLLIARFLWASQSETNPFWGVSHGNKKEKIQTKKENKNSLRTNKKKNGAAPSAGRPPDIRQAMPGARADPREAVQAQALRGQRGLQRFSQRRRDLPGGRPETNGN